MSVEGISAVRFHLALPDGPRRICKVGFSNSDASIYLLPTPVGGPYYFGQERMTVGVPQYTFKWDAQEVSPALPKLSMHQSGQLHVRAPGGAEAGPIHLPRPLRMLRGENIAVLEVDHFDALPVYKKALSDSGPVLDVVALPTDGMLAARVLLYLNGNSADFKMDPPPQAVVKLTRPSLSQPFFLGIGTVSRHPLPGCGVTVIAGHETQPDFLFIRCGT